MKNNLWILTEERPKKEVLKYIFIKFSKEYSAPAFVDNLRIIPVLKNDNFTFIYEVTGFQCNKVDKVYIKTVSGNSSFTDFLVFYQQEEPAVKDQPIYAIEETKTDDSESRNTGVYQRSSKFVFIDKYYPEAKKIMFYNLKIKQKVKSSNTYVFGTRLLLTLDIEIVGKDLDKKIFNPFKNIDEIIDVKNKMRKAPHGNVAILVKKVKNTIEVSGRLYKNKGLSHDPNIGALSLICAVIRKLGWKNEIIITNHGLKQEHVGKNNKFILIANKLNISLQNLTIPRAEFNKEGYWKFDLSGEKLGTIFIHLVIKSFTSGEAIFENHAGCEKGYFITKDGDPIPLEKYNDRQKYKDGDKKQIISIPDLIILDNETNQIINAEGKKYKFLNNAIKDIEEFKSIEKNYIKKYYPKHKIIRTIILYGSDKESISEPKVGFLLNENGKLILGIKAPDIFHKAINNLLDYWK